MPVVVDREAQLQDPDAIADMAVADAAHGAVAPGDGGHQFAPGGVGAAGVGGVDHGIARPQRIHELDFQAIGVFGYGIIGIHPPHRAGAADEAAGAGIGQQRAQALVHGLVPVAQGVENIADGGDIQMLAHPDE